MGVLKPPDQQGGSGSLPGAVVSWTGTWQCGQTRMYLTQSGSNVTGWYDYQNGEISGYAAGSTLVGTWSETVNAAQVLTGDVQLNMAADGNSYSGNYRRGTAGSWTNTWSCKRLSSAVPPARTVQPVAPAPINWSGYWMCGEWGRLILTQTGSTVTGTYSYQGGKFTGYAAGNTLVGTWSEEPTYKEPDDAGDVQFNMSSDGNSFRGNWRYGHSGNWTGTWNGTRQQ
jgi:hypothetical protein